MEVLVSDNGSSDDTYRILKEYESSHKELRIHRHEQNIGGDENFYYLVQHAVGKYIWIFGDDDKMEPLALSQIMVHTKKDYDAIILNFSTWSHDFKEMLKKSYYGGKKIQFFQLRDIILRNFGLKLGFISSVIVKRSLFLKTSYQCYLEFIGYGWAFLYAIYNGLNKNCNVLYLPQSLVCYRGNNVQAFGDRVLWYKYFAIGSSVLFEKLRELGYSSRSVYRAEKSVLITYILHDISHRKRKNQNLKGILKTIFPLYRGQYFFWFVILPLLLSPRFMVHSVHKAVIIARKVIKKCKCDSLLN